MKRLLLLITIISTGAQAQWTTATLSQGRDRLAATAVGTKAFFAGGFSSSGNLSSVVDIYDTNTNTWTTATLSQGRISLCAAAVGTKVFFAGGSGTGGISNVVDIYDNSTNAWSTATLSVARSDLSATSVGTKVFFAGGAGNGDSDVVDIYDNSTNTWSTATLGVKRNTLSATSVGTKVFFAGGWNSTGAGSNVVDIYDNSTNTWSTANLLSQARYGLAATSVGTKVFFAGGSIGTPLNTLSTVVDIYDNSTNTWSTAAARKELSATAVGTKVFFAGGSNGSFSTNSTVVDIYTTSPPTIASLSPSTGGVNHTVVINGANFDQTPASNLVKFNGTTATITASTGTSITTSVPSGATTGPVTVTVGGQTATSATNFTVAPPTAPTIASFTPITGPFGTAVTIAGTNFSSTPANNTVKFNNTTATVTASTATSITATVPAGSSPGTITITVGGQTATSAVNFKVTSPIITSFNPITGSVLTAVTITGTAFDPIPANNTVRFNGTNATVTASTTTSITTTVPAGATTGPITVSVGGEIATSTGTFTVTAPTDTTIPVVASNATPAAIAPNTQITVSANFTDASGITSAKVLYRPIAGAPPNNYVSSNMTLASGFNFTGSIPASAVTELGVEYKYLIVDGVGLDNTSTQVIFTTRIDQAGGLDLTSYPTSAAGVESTNYRIISIPLVKVDKTALGAFSDEIGSYDPTAWRMFKYNGTTFTELNGNSILTPGEGYWFIALSSSPLNIGAGTTVDVSTASPFTITLNPGWNQIGNPYNFNISWADVVAANPTQAANLGGNNSKIRVFRGSIENLDVLKVLEGGFVKYLGSTATPIKIPVSKNLSVQGRQSADQENKIENSLDELSWEILFNLKAGNTEYKLGGLGMHPEAKEGFDYHDDFNSPRFMDFLEVKFPKKYFGMTYTKDVVPTSENYSWQFSVESNIKNEVASLSWDNSYFGNAKEIYLLDVALHKVTNMNLQDRYEFNRTESKEFKVVFGNGDFVKQELLPTGIVLYDPYPNPFTSEVSIGYALPKEVSSAQAEIEVYNSMGSRVSQLQTSQPGVGNWVWRSEDQSPGLYFIRLKAGNQSVTKKALRR